MWSVSNPEVDRLARARYVSLTTFRRTGEPVATPVWVTTEEDFLIVFTDADSGKVKRIRNNNEVTVAPCDARGGLQGDPVPGRAELLDAPELIDRARGLLRRKYGWQAYAADLLARLRGGRDHMVVAIQLDDEG